MIDLLRYFRATPATANSAIGSAAERTALGASLEQARASEFFRWFHLIEVSKGTTIDCDAQKGEGQVRHRFRPSGSTFGELVDLTVGVSGDGNVCTACLGIDRGFIADSRIRPFARDIAKSFLSWVLPLDACNALAPEIAAISQFCDGESVVLARTDAVPTPGRPCGNRLAGGVADVFIGNAAHFEQNIGRTRIAVANRIEPFPSSDVSASSDTTLHGVSGDAPDVWLRLEVSTLSVR